jgi:soluble lytic murein transglycosylase-like protein
MMMALPTEPKSSIAGINTAGGAKAAEARIQQLKLLRAALTKRAELKNMPVNEETFRTLLEQQLNAAAKRKALVQQGIDPDAGPTTVEGAPTTTLQPYPYAGKPINPLSNTVPNSLQARRQAISGDINALSQKYGLDPMLIDAVIQQESGYQSKVVSKAGAIGLMQLMPATAKDLGVSNPYDAKQNMEGGIKYLSQQLNRFGGNVALALAAYNAGPGAVQKYGGIPPYKETRNYVRRILKNYLTQKYQP